MTAAALGLYSEFAWVSDLLASSRAPRCRLTSFGLGSRSRVFSLFCAAALYSLGLYTAASRVAVARRQASALVVAAHSS